MKTFKLNLNKISELIRRKSVTISSNQTLEIYDDKLVINCDGVIYDILSTDIHFNEQKMDNRFVVDYLQNLICEHLNLEQNMVIFITNSKHEYEFKIKFNYKTIWNIIVCDSITATNNARLLYDEFTDFSYQAENIGPYKKLGDSAYYFRWYEKI